MIRCNTIGETPIMLLRDTIAGNMRGCWKTQFPSREEFFNRFRILTMVSV